MITIDQVKDKTGLVFQSKLRFYKSSPRPITVRQNGKVKVWEREPKRFQIPVKFGLYEYGYIDNSNSNEWNIL